MHYKKRHKDITKDLSDIKIVQLAKSWIDNLDDAAFLEVNKEVTKEELSSAGAIKNEWGLLLKTPLNDLLRTGLGPLSAVERADRRFASLNQTKEIDPTFNAFLNKNYDAMLIPGRSGLRYRNETNSKYGDSLNLLECETIFSSNNKKKMCRRPKGHSGKHSSYPLLGEGPMGISTGKPVNVELYANSRGMLEPVILIEQRTGITERYDQVSSLKNLSK